MLFVESPRCEERLQIRLESDVYGVIEEIELYGQRYMMLCTLSIYGSTYPCKLIVMLEKVCDCANEFSE